MPLAVELSRVAADSRAVVSSVRAPWTPWRVSVAFLWAAGIVGDALTTILMMRTGLFEEANGVAATGMTVLGVVGYSLVASLICVPLALVASAPRPKTLYAGVAWGCCLLIGVVKIYTAASNGLLWWSVTG